MTSFTMIALLLSVTIAVASANTCIGSGRVVRQFSGRRDELFMPCKYDAVKQRCGKYDVKLTPGNIYMQPKFRMDSLWLAVTDTETGEVWAGRSTNKIAVKYYRGWSTELFNQKGGSMATEDLLVFGTEGNYGFAEAVNGDFRVSFMPWDPENKDFNQASWVFACNAPNFVPSGFAKQVCGGSDPRESAEKRNEMGLNSRIQLIQYNIFTNTDIVQTNSQCANVTRLMTQVCTEEQRKDAVMTCGEMLSSRKHTKCITKYACDPMEAFKDCVEWVCSDYQDDLACERLGEAMDMCRTFKEGNLTAKVEDAKCFRDFLHLEDSTDVTSTPDTTTPNLLPTSAN